MDSFRRLAGALVSEYHRVIFDLGELRTIDCAGLAEMVWCAARAKESGTEVGLLRLTHGIRDLLVITRLATLFDYIDERSHRAALIPGCWMRLNVRVTAEFPGRAEVEVFRSDLNFNPFGLFNGIFIP